MNCPVCDGDNYREDSGWQGGEPIDPPEAWCDDCGYSWQYSGGEGTVTEHIAYIRSNITALRAQLAVWERVLAENPEDDLEED